MRVPAYSLAGRTRCEKRREAEPEDLSSNSAIGNCCFSFHSILAHSAALRACTHKSAFLIDVRLRSEALRCRELTG